jgi:hypothetical protein
MKNAAFLDRLATLHTGWKLYWPDWDRMPPSGKIQEIWTAPEQKRTELRRKEFCRLADVLAQDWAQLEKASEKFAALRAKWIAHHELEYDEQTRTYFQPKIPTLTQLYSTLEDVIVTITRCVLHLAIVFKGTDIGLRSFRDVAKRDAANFWRLKTSPNVGVRLKAGQLRSN